MTEIAAGRWRGIESVRALAAQWGVNPGSVKRIAAEARRRVGAVDGDGFVRKLIAVTCDRLTDEAMEMIRRGDVRAINGLVAVMRLWADVTGAYRTSPASDGPAVFRIGFADAERPSLHAPTSNRWRP